MVLLLFVFRFNASGLKQHVFNTHESNGICNICGAQVRIFSSVHASPKRQTKDTETIKCNIEFQTLVFFL